MLNFLLDTFTKFRLPCRRKMRETEGEDRRRQLREVEEERESRDGGRRREVVVAVALLVRDAIDRGFADNQVIQFWLHFFSLSEIGRAHV